MLNYNLKQSIFSVKYKFRIEESHTSCDHLGSSKLETVLVIEPVMDAQRQGETGSQIKGLMHATNRNDLCLNMTAFFDNQIIFIISLC